MRKFLIICAALILAALAGNYLYFHTSLYLDLRPSAEIRSLPALREDHFGGYGRRACPLEIRGVDMGTGKPGHFATEFAVTRDEYLRWFGQIQAIGGQRRAHLHHQRPGVLRGLLPV